MKKLLLSFSTLTFLVACGDGSVVKFSKEDLADPRLQYAFEEIKKENNNDNIEFYAIETIKREFSELYTLFKKNEIKTKDKYDVGIYAINKTKNNIKLLYNIRCFDDIKSCNLKDETKGFYLIGKN